jgi:hypothetical protein
MLNGAAGDRSSKRNAPESAGSLPVRGPGRRPANVRRVVQALLRAKGVQSAQRADGARVPEGAVAAHLPREAEGTCAARGADGQHAWPSVGEARHLAGGAAGAHTKNGAEPPDGVPARAASRPPSTESGDDDCLDGRGESAGWKGPSTRDLNLLHRPWQSW